MGYCVATARDMLFDTDMGWLRMHMYNNPFRPIARDVSYKEHELTHLCQNVLRHKQVLRWTSMATMVRIYGIILSKEYLYFIILLLFIMMSNVPKVWMSLKENRSWMRNQLRNWFPYQMSWIVS